jgi:hypothetical protein
MMPGLLILHLPACKTKAGFLSSAPEDLEELEGLYSIA